MGEVKGARKQKDGGIPRNRRSQELATRLGRIMMSLFLDTLNVPIQGGDISLEMLTMCPKVQIRRQMEGDQRLQKRTRSKLDHPGPRFSVLRQQRSKKCLDLQTVHQTGEREVTDTLQKQCGWKRKLGNQTGVQAPWGWNTRAQSGLLTCKLMCYMNAKMSQSKDLALTEIQFETQLSDSVSLGNSQVGTGGKSMNFGVRQMLFNPSVDRSQF